MTAIADHRAVLRGLPPDEWDAYLAANSGLPGPRGNLELLQAVADEADPDRIRRYAASTDEYEAACGAVGLGRLLPEGDDRVVAELAVLAGDERWRVREGVAMALQRWGDADLPALLAVAATWADGDPFAAAGRDRRRVRTPLPRHARGGWGGAGADGASHRVAGSCGRT